MNKVHLADCMDIMRNMPNKSVDLCIVDPPYNVGAAGGSHGQKKGKSRRELKIYANHNITPGEEYFTQLFRISKNQIVWGFNYYPQYLYHSGAVVWRKKNYNAGILSDCELAWQSLNKLVRLFDFPWAGFIKGYNGKLFQYKTIHPNEKPVDLYKWLLQNYAKPGQTIFDSHVGSGSIRIACHDMGFDFEGCELDQDYWEAQEERFQNHIVQGELFSKGEYQKEIF